MKPGVDACSLQTKRLPAKVLDDPTRVQALVQDIVETHRETYQGSSSHFDIDGKS
jgi:hypothetical protein